MKKDSSSQFIDEKIEVEFTGEQPLEKTPRCPNRISWRGSVFEVIEQLSEWREFGRKGRKARNMQPEHASRDSRVGSWGVGRFYFRVIVNTKRVMEIYYDRAPIDVDQRKGSWFLLSVKSPDKIENN